VSTQVFVASTAFGLATVAAALADGLFDESLARVGPPPRRVLVVTSNADMPEAVPGLLEVSGAAGLAGRFDAVYDYNELIEPQHPTIWRPREDDLPLWERHFADQWALTGDVTLVVESVQTDPALALCRIFADARIDVYGDGLMSYGPTRNPLPDSVGARVERLLHLDLVPGVAPLLLWDWQVPGTVVSTTAFRRVIAEMTSTYAERSSDPVVLVLGQYLAAADLLTEAEETALYVEMVVSGAQAHGGRVVFKPHPSAPRTQHLALRCAAEAAGVDLSISADTELAESWFARGGVTVVIGCFSTALLTAASCYELPVARVGTELMLDRLTPYQNSNRIPVTIVDALVPELGASHPPETEVVRLDELVAAVGYAMQPRRYAGRRSAAVDFLARYPASGARYVKRQRLTRLQLPGALPSRPPRSRVRRTLRRVHRVLASNPPTPLQRLRP
jgi:hypothetical protein